MNNNEVPMDVVQRLLDHGSPEMTARYATIKGQTLRREWERFRQRCANSTPKAPRSASRASLAAPASCAQWLYTRRGPRQQIEALRDRGPVRTDSVPARQRASEASLRQRLRSLRDENQRLRKQNHSQDRARDRLRPAARRPVALTAP